jgi:Methyltransferase domain
MTTSFDPIAQPYRWMEYATFGPLLERCRYAQLERLGAARRALILGDGDGRFLARLLATNLRITADVVDSSAGMLHMLDRRIRKMGGAARDRICLHRANVLDWRPPGRYDLVVSHFFLDCFFPEEIEQILDRLLPHVVPEAQWIISEFAVPRHGPGHYIAPATIGALYRSFGLLTGLGVRALPDYGAALRRRDWKLVDDEGLLFGLLHSQLWVGPTGLE